MPRQPRGGANGRPSTPALSDGIQDRLPPLEPGEDALYRYIAAVNSLLADGSISPQVAKGLMDGAKAMIRVFGMTRQERELVELREMNKKIDKAYLDADRRANEARHHLRGANAKGRKDDPS